MTRARSCPGAEEFIFYVASPNLDGERRGQGRWPGAQLADDAMTPHRLLFIPRAGSLLLRRIGRHNATLCFSFV